MIKKLLYVVLLLALIVPALLPQVAMAQTTVDSNINTAANYTQQGKRSWYAHDLIWSFYSLDSNLYYKTSPDLGSTWGSRIEILTIGSLDGKYSVDYDGTYFHFAARYKISDYYALYYRRGQPLANGTISWSAGWQNCGSFSGSGYTLSAIDIAVDSGGYPWVIYSRNWDNLSYVTKSNRNDGVWATESGYPLWRWTNYTFRSGNAGVVKLTGAKMAIWAVGGSSTSTKKIRIQRYDAGWGAEVSSTFNVNGVAGVVQDDIIHFVYSEYSTNNIKYVAYDASTNSLGTPTALYEGTASNCFPTIGRDTTNNDLWVWWEEYPTADHLFMAVYKSAEATWYSYYDFLDEIDDLPAAIATLNTFYTAPRDAFGIFYVAGTAILKFKYLDEQFDVDTLEPTGVTETQATLRGEIVSIGWGTPYERGFYWDTTPSLGNATGTLELWYETGSFSTGVFTHTASDLAEGQSYYYIAYATNAETVYGEWVETTAGGTEGWCVVTLEPDPVGDFEATFRGNITELAGSYATVHGFQWGHTATATWEWTDTGEFTVGVYTYEAELEADSIYYVRALTGNSTVTDYGQWVGFITQQPSYEDTDVDDSQILPPAPEEPGGWIKPPREWGTALGIPWTFILFVFLSSIVVIIGIALSAVQARTISVLFIVFGFILGWFCFWPRGGYLDWWIMLPYILVGCALMNREKESPLA